MRIPDQVVALQRKVKNERKPSDLHELLQSLHTEADKLNKYSVWRK
jgi:hypothetical protein